jgi:hypothetical protein
MARLHIYPHDEPRKDLHIIAEPAALKALAHSLMKVANSPHAFERVKLHTSDGHEYTAMIVADVPEQEWQTIPPAYAKSVVPPVKVLENYHALRKEIELSRQESM